MVTNTMFHNKKQFFLFYTTVDCAIPQFTIKGNWYRPGHFYTRVIANREMTNRKLGGEKKRHEHKQVISRVGFLQARVGLLMLKESTKLKQLHLYLS